MTSVISIAYAVKEPDIRKALLMSDMIREETLRRCYAIPSYEGKAIAWKNRYYDHFKKQIIAELRQKGVNT